MRGPGSARPPRARGAIHLLNGLYDAKQEVDLLSLSKDVVSEYVPMVTVPEQLPNVLDRAIRIAQAPGPATS